MEQEALSLEKLELINSLKDMVAERKDSTRDLLPGLCYALSPESVSANALLIDLYESGLIKSDFVMRKLRLRLGVSVLRELSKRDSVIKTFWEVAKEPAYYIDEDLRMEDIILSWFSKIEVPFILAAGYMGSGKTDFALRIAEVMSTRYNVITNIRNTAYACITDFAAVEKYCMDNEGLKLFILDEAAIHFGVRDFMTKDNREFIKFLKLLRKYKTAVVFITQKFGYVDKQIREFANVVVSKINKKTCRVIDDTAERKTYALKNVRGTKIAYDTYDVAAFSLGRAKHEGGKHDVKD